MADKKLEDMTGKELALHTLDVGAAIAAALSKTPEFVDAEGGKLAVSVLSAINDESHRTLLEGMSDDNPSDEELDSVFEACSNAECSTQVAASACNDYTEVKRAAQLLDILRRDIDTAINQLRYRARELAPDKFADEDGPGVPEGMQNIMALLQQLNDGSPPRMVNPLGGKVRPEIES